MNRETCESFRRNDSSVAVVINFQIARSRANREILRALYGERFPKLGFCVGPDLDSGADVDLDAGSEPDTIVSSWRPTRLLHHQCGACPAEYSRHPAGIHQLHPRLVAIAESPWIEGADWLLFVEDDCLLGPHVTPETLVERAGDAEVVLSPVWLCDRDDDDAWLWPWHPTGYPAFTEPGVADRLDRDRLLAHWEAYSGHPAPPLLYTPLFGAFADWILIRPSLLRRLVPDLLAMAEVWHELAIPTALMHHSARIGLTNGLSLWGHDRNQPLERLLGLLPGRDFVHAIKPGLYPPEALIAGYRALTPSASAIAAGPDLVAR